LELNTSTTFRATDRYGHLLPYQPFEETMKKFVALLLCLSLSVFSFGCGDKAKDKKPAPAAGGDKGDDPPATPGDQDPKGQ
jgi:hypothetical protein